MNKVNPSQRHSGQVRGASEIDRRFAKEILKIRGDLYRGFEAGLKLMKAEAQVLTPVDTGNLIGSIFTQVKKTRKWILGRIGYTASYAFFAHEMPETTNWRKEGAESKFLTKAIQRNYRAIIKEIRKYAKR